MGEMGNPIRVVVYGGIGSGKSTVTARLAERGVRVIDADKLGHAVLQPDGAAFAAVAERWPQVIESGVVNRSTLGAIVFADRRELADLEAITHPHIRAQIEEIVSQSVGEHLALELPILRAFVGDGWERVLIDAPLDQRIERVVARGSSREDATARAAAQPSDADYHLAADWVIANTGSLSDLRDAVDELWEQLLAA